MQDKPTILLLIFLLGVGFAFLPQASGDEAEPLSASSLTWPVSANAIWNGASAGEREEGEFLDLTDPASPHFGGKWLVLTDLDVRTATGIYVRLVEKRKKMVRGEPVWETVERRGALFMRDFQIATSGYTGGTYQSLAGLKFAPGSKIGLEVVQGDGEVRVHAEGYWTSE